MTKYKKNERIPFTDDLMFSLVVRDENICRQLLERILPESSFKLIQATILPNALDITRQIWISIF